jgi:hypothetical protein
MQKSTGLARFVAVVAVIVGVGTMTVAPARAAVRPQESADVLVQAGHEGRPDCEREPARLCNNTGTPGEIRWTPVVADEATRVLRAHGIRVLRKPAALPGDYHVRVAVFLHFDGSASPCGSAASVGYPKRAHAAAAAAAWKTLYARFWPYGFESDNFTPTEAGYYGFSHVKDVADSAVLIEGGEMTCPRQRAWLEPRLRWEGDLVAYYVMQRLGRPGTPLPVMRSGS